MGDDPQNAVVNTVADDTAAAQHYPAIVRLTRSVWPSSDGKDHFEEDVMNRADPGPEGYQRHIMLFTAGELRAYACAQLRTITIGGRPVRNMALGSVCTEKSCRGNGYGRMVVQKAFELIDNGTFDCTVFQTQVPGFYEKLGARLIKNKIVNSLNGGAWPFWDPNIMIYPAGFSVRDDEVIDLLGPGY